MKGFLLGQVIDKSTAIMVFIYDSDALDRLTAVEGEPWRKLQDRSPASPYCFHAWKLAWDERQRMAQTNPEYDDEPVSSFVEGGDGAIYGSGGWNRYTVTVAGELVLRAWSSTEANRAKAERAGFRVA